MIYDSIIQSKSQGKKQFAVLIDPDNITSDRLIEIIEKSVYCGVDYIFIGGSLLISGHLDNYLKIIKQHCSIPVILFPGSPLQISNQADAILFLSLISGRNPELLIGNHVIAASSIKRSGLEIIPTGYMLIDGGKPTTASYISNTFPIPNDKDDIAVSTAMAGEMLGLKLIYMDAGSGASMPIKASMIKKVSEAIHIPLIVGGGIKTPETIIKNYSAGADLIVIGNAIEKNIQLIEEIYKCKTTNSI